MPACTTSSSFSNIATYVLSMAGSLSICRRPYITSGEPLLARLLQGNDIHRHNGILREVGRLSCSGLKKAHFWRQPPHITHRSCLRHSNPVM